MSHFAQVIDGIVQQVIVAEQDFIDTLENPSQWIQTSYNTRWNVHYINGTDTPSGSSAFRGNYAGKGDIYDAENDVFYAQQPYPSWTLNKNKWAWESPVPYPNDGNNYLWDETSQQWKISE